MNTALALITQQLDDQPNISINSFMLLSPAYGKILRILSSYVKILDTLM